MHFHLGSFSKLFSLHHSHLIMCNARSFRSTIPTWTLSVNCLLSIFTTWIFTVICFVWRISIRTLTVFVTDHLTRTQTIRLHLSCFQLYSFGTIYLPLAISTKTLTRIAISLLVSRPELLPKPFRSITSTWISAEVFPLNHLWFGKRILNKGRHRQFRFWKARKHEIFIG